MSADDLQRLAADLQNARPVTAAKVRGVVQKGAVNVKNDWRAAWSGLRSAPSLAAAVTYDVKVTADGVEAEIGPDKDRRQGALGNLLEFGSRNNAPTPGGEPALQAEEPRFAKAMEDIAGKLL